LFLSGVTVGLDHVQAMTNTLEMLRCLLHTKHFYICGIVRLENQGRA
jgi:hypothetical protein